MFTGFNLHSKKYNNYGLYLKNSKNYIPYIKKCDNVALFTNARDEPHIKEWAAHHLLIGFDYIFITDHLSITPLTNVFKDFDSRVVINTCTIKTNIKIHLMNEAITTAKKYNVDWFIYLDADEFIVFNDKVTNITNIKDFLSFYNRKADMIAINWLLFGSNYLENEPDSILGSYTKSDTYLDRHIKSFVRPNEALYAETPHVYAIKHIDNFYAYDKKIGTLTSFCESNILGEECPIYIAHYINQSKESFIKRKIIKPTDDTGKYRGQKDKNLIENIHNNYNNNNNIQPKRLYHEKVQMFLKKEKEKDKDNDTAIVILAP
jgi:hypothetical protein